MSNVLEYTLSLQDLISTKLQKIGLTSDTAVSKFSKLSKQSRETSELFNKMGTSIGTLKAKLDLLKAEKEWIPSKNISDIKKYNSEISKLEKQISKLESSGGIKNKLSNILSSIPGADFLTNPYVAATAAITVAGRASMSFDEGMAKINTTAQLTKPQLQGLEDQLTSFGLKGLGDVNKLPEAYEKILSQTGDVSLSMDILEKSLYGAKAGFTEQSVVAGALAQTLSIVGKENTNAQEVLDTFLMAKKVGAGEFQDLACK